METVDLTFFNDVKLLTISDMYLQTKQIVSLRSYTRRSVLAAESGPPRPSDKLGHLETKPTPTSCCTTMHAATRVSFDTIAYSLSNFGGYLHIIRSVVGTGPKRADIAGRRRFRAARRRYPFQLSANAAHQNISDSASLFGVQDNAVLLE